MYQAGRTRVTTSDSRFGHPAFFFTPRPGRGKEPGSHFTYRQHLLSSIFFSERNGQLTNPSAEMAYFLVCRRELQTVRRLVLIFEGTSRQAMGRRDPSFNFSSIFSRQLDIRVSLHQSKNGMFFFLIFETASCFWGLSSPIHALRRSRCVVQSTRLTLMLNQKPCNSPHVPRDFLRFSEVQ